MQRVPAEAASCPPRLLFSPAGALLLRAVWPSRLLSSSSVAHWSPPRLWPPLTLSLCSPRSSSFPRRRCSGSGDVMQRCTPDPSLSWGEECGTQRGRGQGHWPRGGRRCCCHSHYCPWWDPSLESAILRPRLWPLSSQVATCTSPAPSLSSCLAQWPFWSQLLKPVSCSRVRLLSGSWRIWTQMGP